MQHTMTERSGVVTFKGAPMTLVGPELRAGDPAPDVTLVGSDLAPVTVRGLTEGGTRGVLLIAVPSLDTGVCSLESEKFNARLDEMPSTVTACVVSMDLPFAQSRWASERSGVRLRLLSDYRDRAFGPAYGVLIKELGLLARSIFVVRPDGTLVYVQIVPEVASEPDYDAAVAAARAAVG